MQRPRHFLSDGISFRSAAKSGLQPLLLILYRQSMWEIGSVRLPNIPPAIVGAGRHTHILSYIPLTSNVTLARFLVH